MSLPHTHACLPLVGLSLRAALIYRSPRSSGERARFNLPPCIPAIAAPPNLKKPVNTLKKVAADVRRRTVTANQRRGSFTSGCSSLPDFNRQTRETRETWHEAISFADLVYQITGHFPADERFGLTNQMRRAAVSISSNIAEGCSRSSRADYARFVEIATASVFEAVSQPTIGRRQGFLSDTEYQQLYQAAEKQSRMLSGLRKSLDVS